VHHLLLKFKVLAGKWYSEESLQEFVKWYNDKRIHDVLDYKIPEEVYRENL
jgi:transposase InsO family protein